MVTTVADTVFVDTNTLVYATMSAAPFHQEAEQALKALDARRATVWISRQIIREYLAVLSRTQPFSQPVPPADLAQQLQRFEARFQIADEDARTTAALLALLQQVPVGGKQVHDANIVATMQVHGIARLLTHNVADFARFTPRITVLPLIPAP